MQKITAVLVGQPNVGKSSLLNAISGSNFKVGNFSGVTISKSQATFIYKDIEFTIIDLPGTYSLNDYSPEEKITKDFLQTRQYDVIINVVDSTNLERNLSLSAQILDLSAKTILALNMIDEAQKEQIHIDIHKLNTILGIPCIPISADKHSNISALLDEIIITHNKPFCEPRRIYSDILESQISSIEQFLLQKSFYELNTYPSQDNALSMRQIAILLLKLDPNLYEYIHNKPCYSQVTHKVNATITHIEQAYGGCNMRAIFFDDAFSFGHGVAQEVVHYPKNLMQNTHKIDSILLDKYWGIPIFLFLMFVLFELTFVVGGWVKDHIEEGFGALGEILRESIPSADFASLLCDGIIGGVGTILAFLPLIIVLYLGIALLEGTGYMARVAFLLDGLFHKFGLHGKSFIPLVAGFGCSVPAYMAARTLKNPNERLITLFVIGFMSCSARLPIYVLFVGAFCPQQYAGLALFGIYFLGTIVTLLMAKFLNLTIFRGYEEPFVMEMPKYRLPNWRTIWFGIYSKVLMFLKKAGGFILFGSMLIWFASQYPKNPALQQEYDTRIQAVQNSNLDDVKKQQEIWFLTNEHNEQFLKQTYSGRIGQAIMPFFAPMDFDWRLSISLVAGFAAKEVVVSTLGILYALGDETDEHSLSLQKNLKDTISLSSAVAFIVFVMFYIPCFAATITFGREAGGMKFVAYLFIFTTAVAYIFSLLAYYLTQFFYSHLMYFF
ncbi:ferrous iron transport protein B [Helicobacter fennelliae]|uniref:Ferrous iron transport protein B n=1 Tax=Helicobacter fennelliae MRY12-0050 TaxID=1325130 RepID=T1DV89_9HELI|nr:ferrous iron transport protein B [Helicobacter fennelliae]GAD18533.1 ferrous iron transport protein B [Helicobacter fennelliae MRY12-0050]STP06919.1 ferrous iron transport protein [Helicobacter fennelliae]